MGRVVGTFVAAAALAAWWPALAQQAAEPPVPFQVDVQLVRVLATVKAPTGELVGSLGKSDFEVWDNSVKQEISVFERTTAQPLSVSLLVDTSASTAKDLRYELDSSARFLRSLFAGGNDEDTAALYRFSYDVELLSSFTRRLGRLESALRALKPDSGTSLYDAIYLASRDLEDRGGRHVIVVVTDGGDTTSAKTFHHALEAAQLANAVIYSILVMPITNDAGRNIGGENALTTLAVETGGRVFVPSYGAELDAAFTEIIRDLRTQYLLAFYPRNLAPTTERFHRLYVKVRGPYLQVQTRSGYYGGSSGPAGKGAGKRAPWGGR
jgi:Ca-activated chloride channel family protein